MYNGDGVNSKKLLVRNESIKVGGNDLNLKGHRNFREKHYQ